MRNAKCYIHRYRHKYICYYLIHVYNPQEDYLFGSFKFIIIFGMDM